MPHQYEMQDPRTQYPQPEFDEQSFGAPGTTDQMDPKPDHGEESYKGFGRLAGRLALVTGRRGARRERDRRIRPKGRSQGDPATG